MAPVWSLASTTSRAWAERALGSQDELLIDHAHCEKKAAGTALSLLFRYPQQTFLALPLSRLAREEMVHFEQVLLRLAARGVAFRPLRASPYAGRLRAASRAQEPGRLVDALLCSALIEARSHERLGLLADAVCDEELRDFYAGLCAAEERHGALYVGLAEQVEPEPRVRARFEELALHEARVLSELAPMARLHA
jgi:tRNA-(ms[2]io[6]A)-hydroxylase